MNTNVENRAKATTSQLGQFINSQHLHLVSSSPLADEPFLEFYHLYVLKSNACVDFTFDNCLRDVHPAADSLIVIWRHAIVLGQLIDLDLLLNLVSLRKRKGEERKLEKPYLPKLPDIPNHLPLQTLKISRNSTPLQIHHTRKRFIEQRTNTSDRESTSFSSESVDHSFEAEIYLAAADDFGYI